jgi:hypothetical protein
MSFPEDGPSSRASSSPSATNSPTAADEAALSMCQRLLARVLASDPSLDAEVTRMKVRAIASSFITSC